jgi:hypothetical protein
VWLQSIGGKIIDITGSFLLKPFKSFHSYTNLVPNIKMFFSSFTSKYKLVFKALLVLPKQKENKIPKVF